MEESQNLKEQWPVALSMGNKQTNKQTSGLSLTWNCKKFQVKWNQQLVMTDNDEP